MQIEKKKLVKTIGLIAVILVIISLVLVYVLVRSKRANEYYYKFKYDDNLITQSVWVYDGNGKLQTDYYLFYNDKPVTYTNGEKAVLTIVLLDLKEEPNLELKFKSDMSDEKTYEVKFKDE